jgi:glucose/arabinose dehydrogenase
VAEIVAKTIVTGLTRPIFLTSPPGDLDRLFIAEQHTGKIRIFSKSAQSLLPGTFLQIAGLSTTSEQGLLGLAFHPQFSSNGLFFVYFTDTTGKTVVQRFQVSSDPNMSQPSPQATVLTVAQPFANHNGGWMAFGPKDRFLYIGLGDGGNANDPGRRAQNRAELLGKILRIDVDGDAFPGDNTRTYRIPASNPFVNQPGLRGEIWAWGLRNPWRCSFDRLTSDLYIGDVGQDKFEEIDFQRAASTGGENYGWRLKEGLHATGLEPVGTAELVDPIHEYDHDVGVAVIGGYVYRGAAIPSLNGTYFFAEHTGEIFSFRFDGTVKSEFKSRSGELFAGGSVPRVSSFGEDTSGELYILGLSGSVHQLVPAP